MHDKYIQLTNDFIEYEKLRGARSLRKIKYQLNVFFKYIEDYDLGLTEIRRRDAQSFITYLSTLTKSNGSIHYASASVLDIIANVRNLYNYLKRLKMVYSNPFINVKKPKQDLRLPRNIPDEKKMNEFLTHLGNFWQKDRLRDKKTLYKAHVISELMYSTGLRLSEVADIEACDIDFGKGIIFVRGKGGKERSAYLNCYAEKALEIYINEMKQVINCNKDSKKIFGVKDGRMLDAFLNKHLKQEAGASGITGFTSHVFRHAVGFHLLRSGCDMRYIQLILGHDSLNSTMIYTKVCKRDLKNELDKYHPRQFLKQDK